MNAKKTLEEVCELIGKRELHSIMGGSMSFDYDIDLICFIYEESKDVVRKLVKESVSKERKKMLDKRGKV